MTSNKITAHWINANLRLPPDFKPCIICLEGKAESEDCYAIVTEEGWYWWVDGIGDMIEEKVTYWMEHPIPPEA